MEETKICTKCKHKKLISMFYYIKKRERHNSICARCVQDLRPSNAKVFEPTVFLDLKEEIWNTIPNTDNIYQASNLSRIRSIDRYIINKLGVKIFVRGRMIKQYVSKDSKERVYYSACICIKNKKSTINSHTLIFSAFHGFSPVKGSGMVIDHRDNNSLNNHLSNLQLITHRENSSKDMKKGASKYTGVTWRKDSLKWNTSIGINGMGQIKIFNSIDEDLCGLAYKIALENIDKYNGNNQDFRNLIKSLVL